MERDLGKASLPEFRVAGLGLKSSPLFRARILLVDDDDKVRASVRRVLQSNHDVVEVPSAREALRALDTGEVFDLILCDLLMPDMDGPALYRCLREAHPDIVDRVVFLSGGACTPRASAFLAAAQPAFLEKPVSRSVLLGVAQRFAGMAARDDVSPADSEDSNA